MTRVIKRHIFIFHIPFINSTIKTVWSNNYMLDNWREIWENVRYQFALQRLHKKTLLKLLSKAYENTRSKIPQWATQTQKDMKIFLWLIDWLTYHFWVSTQKWCSFVVSFLELWYFYCQSYPDLWNFRIDFQMARKNYNQTSNVFSDKLCCVCTLDFIHP